VRLVLTREQMYGLGYRPATIERVALGAKTGGTLDAIKHEAIAMTSQYEKFSRNDTGWSEMLYKSANAKYVHKLVPSICQRRPICGLQARPPVSLRSNAQWTSLLSRSRLIRWNYACGAIQIATSRRMFPTPANS
jgi:hypothetical protein